MPTNEEKPQAEKLGKPPEATPEAAPLVVKTPEDAKQFLTGAGGIDALTKAINANTGGGDIYRSLDGFFPKPDDPTLPTKTEFSNEITIAEKVLSQIDVSQAVFSHQYNFTSIVLTAVKAGMMIYPISRGRKGRIEGSDILSLRQWLAMRQEQKEGLSDKLFRVRTDNK